MVRKSSVPRVTSDTEAAPLRALWCAVLEMVVRDAEKGRDLDYVGSRDFCHVCTLAGVDPDAVAERLAPPSKAA